MTKLVSDEQIVSAIAQYIGMHGYSPSMRDVAKMVGMSVGPVKYRLDALRYKGAITFEDGMARTIRVVQR